MVARCTMPVTGCTFNAFDGPRLQNVRPNPTGLFNQQCVKRFPSHSSTPLLLRIGGAGHCSQDCVFSTHQCNVAQLRSGCYVKSCFDSQRIQQRQVAGGQAFTTDLTAWKALLFHQGDGPASARQKNSCRRTGRASPDDDGVKFGLHHKASVGSATKQWLKRPAEYSRTRHAPPIPGQSTDSSSPQNPACTLSTASPRVTAFAPSAPTR